ncbi:MAG: hypothetical protein ABIO83_08620 [Ilumatobacteraceae bacterium]
MEPHSIAPPSSCRTTRLPPACGNRPPTLRAGEQTLFARRDEVEQAWTLATPILDYWARHPRPQFPNYEAGTWGPPEADALIQRDGRRWRRL